MTWIHIPGFNWWYAVTVVDYYSRYLLACHLTPSQSTHDAFAARVKTREAAHHTSFSGRVPTLVTDNDGKHPMRTFGPCPRDTRKWNQTFDRRNSLERINARVGRDFLLDDHFLRGKSAMHLRIGGSMAIMLAIALGCLEKNKPDKMRNLVISLAI